jgi:catechol 2,3-dioxygenase-like lactoylglutathione lyase family enzyme
MTLLPTTSFVLRAASDVPPAPASDQPPHLVAGQTLAVELHVTDPEAAARWFGRFGFGLVRRTPAFIALEHGGQQLFLGRRPASRPSTTGGTIGELRVLVPDVVAARRAVRDDDVVVLDLHRAPYGLVEFVVESPFGIDIRIATPAFAFEVVHP